LRLTLALSTTCCGCGYSRPLLAVLQRYDGSDVRTPMSAHTFHQQERQDAHFKQQTGVNHCATADCAIRLCHQKHQVVHRCARAALQARLAFVLR
jgi:hypothetical protein